MKKIIFSSLVIAVMAITSFTNLPDKIVGRWQHKLYDGSMMLLVFRSDSTCEGFVNGKTFSTGKYYMKKDTMFVSDPLCNTAYYGPIRSIILQQIRYALLSLKIPAWAAMRECTIFVWVM